MVAWSSLQFFPYPGWGLVGAAVASSGWSSVIMGGVIKIVLFIVIAHCLVLSCLS